MARLAIEEALERDIREYEVLIDDHGNIIEEGEWVDAIYDPLIHIEHTPVFKEIMEHPGRLKLAMDAQRYCKDTRGGVVRPESH